MKKLHLEYLSPAYLTEACSAMAVAILRGFSLDMDDKRAIKTLSRHYPKVPVQTAVPLTEIFAQFRAESSRGMTSPD